MVVPVAVSLALKFLPERTTCWRAAVATTVLVSATLIGCSRSTTVWDRPWNCFRASDGASYVCTELDEDRQPTWADWRNSTDSTLAVAYSCTSLPFDAEFDPYDFICMPVFSRLANNFDDNTAPRFHCVGTYDDSDIEKVQFGCEPYWEVTPQVRHRTGSGWFLWLALQAEGEERRQFLTVAQQYESKELKEVDREIAQMATQKDIASTAPSEDDLKQALQTIERLEEQDKIRRRRTLEEISKIVEREKEKWVNLK